MSIRVTVLLTATIFGTSACCGKSGADEKIIKLEAKRDSLLNIEDEAAFRKINDMERLETFEDTTAEYARLKNRIDGSDRISAERSLLLLRLEQRINNLSKNNKQEPN